MVEVEKPPFFSVIMPAYNVSLYLDDAIQSVIKQSFKEWELICVNDGSTDETLSKLKEWAAKDVRIKVLDQTNSGAAKCRVNAIKHSNGDYVSLLDSDDAWSPDMLQLCYEKILKEKVDCVIPNALMNFNSTHAATTDFLFDRYPRSMDELITGKEAFSCTFPWQIAGWFTIRASIAKSLYVDDNISYSRYNSDEYLTRLLLLNCQLVGFCAGVY
ncbi:MAG: glycosyltransferase family 2 protein [Bacteroidaceae bacterium]